MSYLELAILGKNQFWRYLLGFLLIALMWQLVGSVPLVALVLKVTADGDDATFFDPATVHFAGVDPLISYLAISFTFVSLLLGIYLTIRFLHQRPFLTLITPASRMNWSRFFQAFGVYFGLLMLFSLLTFAMSEESLNVTFDASKFFLFLPFALLLTPLQACAEELLFRGYIMQALGRIMSNRGVIALLSSVLFMLPHLMNPEVAIDPVLMPLNYILLGLFLAIITLRDNRLELAMGAHSANNLYAFVFVNYEGSVLESPSILTEAAPDPLFSLIAILVIASLFYWIIFKLLPRYSESGETP